MKKTCIYAMMVAGLCLASCGYDEEALTPSGIEDGYKIASGDADYDKSIAEFYNKYGSCLLYEWTEKDAYWTPSGWKNGQTGSYDDGGKEGYMVFAPEKAYISKQLHVLDRLWFRLYSDEALKKLLPVKILLCSNVQEMEVSWVFTPTFQTVYQGVDIPAYYNYDNIAVSYASSRVDGLTVSDSLTICKALNTQFIESMIGREIIAAPAKFADGVDFTNASSIYTTPEFYSRGIFPDTKSYSPNKENNWKKMLLMMVSFSEEHLTHVPETEISDWGYSSDDFYDGILNEQKDVNGLFRQQYDAVRQYFIDNFGTDLQSVGDAMDQWRQ